MWRGRGGWWASSGASRDSPPRRLHDAAAEPIAGADRSEQRFAVATLAVKPLPEKASLRRATRSVPRWPPPCPRHPSRSQGGGQAPGRAQVRGGTLTGSDRRMRARKGATMVRIATRFLCLEETSSRGSSSRSPGTSTRSPRRRRGAHPGAGPRGRVGTGRGARATLARGDSPIG
jgi:hypothetical protein